MTIRLQADGTKCLYEQIYEHIRQEIREGKLLAGERLPSTRSLAEYLQVSRSTVDLAYSQLLSEGYIEARPSRGHFVCQAEELFRMRTVPSPGTGQKGLAGKGTEGDKLEREGDRLGRGRLGRDRLEREGDRLERKKEALDKKPRPDYDFSPNGIEVGGFPFSVWKKINSNVLRSHSRELTSAQAPIIAHGHSQGEAELRETIGRYLYSSRGVNCHREQIIVGAGTDYLLMLLEKILGSGIRVAMENPTYKRAYQIFCSFGYPVTAVPMDESGMITKKLEASAAEVAYVMPSHQYPTGVVMPVGRRMELLKWAEEKEGRFLIEDDYDSEFRYHGKPLPSLQSLDRQEKVIYMGTFSKSIAPAIRVGYMVLPKPLLLRYWERCAFYSSTVSRIDQRVLDEFIKEGYFERHLNKMRKLYRTKHDLLLGELEPFRKDFHISGENAGLHLLLSGKKGQKEAELIRQGEEQGVRVYGLSEFSWESTGEGHTVLLGYGGLGIEAIKEGIGRLKRAWL